MANRFLVAGGTGNWNSTSNWSGTSGGGSGASFPVAGDVVTFDSLSANAPITVNVASACASLTMGSYTGTMTMTSTLTLTSDITLSSGMTVAGTAALIITNTANLRSNGVIWNASLTLGTFVTYTLLDDWTVGETMGCGSGNTNTVNGFSITCKKHLTVLGNNGTQGTTNFILTGTGTWSQNVVTSAISNNLEINTAGTITVSGTVGYRTGILKYTAGTMTSSSGVINFRITCTVTLNALFTFTGQLLMAVQGVGVTYNGTNGFTVGTFAMSAQNQSIVFGVGASNIYTTTTALSLISTASSPNTIASATGGTQSKFILNPGATQTVAYINPTDIDSSAGQTIWDWKGTLSNATNWRALTANSRTQGHLYVQ